MATDNVLERILKRDRLVVLAGLVAVTVIAWSYLIARFTTTNTMVDGMAEMTQISPWTAVDAVLMWVMWVVMMISMMVPSAAPVILLYARVWRRRSTGGQSLAPIGAFFSGYIAVWAVFSTAATGLQWALERAALLSPMLMRTSPLFGGLILIAAGVYQWTPYKHICLSHCRSPIDFLAAHWRTGARGAFTMGLAHGGYCLGCCWALMGLLFVGGVMNLLYVAMLTIFVLVEKVTPFGRVVSQATGALLVLAGSMMLVEA